MAQNPLKSSESRAMDYQTQTTAALGEALEVLRKKSAANLSTNHQPLTPQAQIERLEIELQISQLKRELQARDLQTIQEQLQTLRQRSEQGHEILSELAENLSSTTSQEEAACVIAATAEALLGWDAFALNLYSADDDKFYAALHIDTVGGKKEKDFTSSKSVSPNEVERRLLDGNGELILREEPLAMMAGLKPFGDTSRPSASLMFMPVRNRTRAIAILSVQSYTLHAYDESDFRLLQILADHCGGTLERIKAEEALRQSEGRLRRLVESNMIGIIFWDRKGNITEANEVFLQMTGYSTADLRAGKVRWNEMTPPEFRDADKKARAELDAHGSCAPFEKDYIAKDGRRIPVLLGSALLEGSNEEGVSFVLNRTQQKRIERRNLAFSELGKNLSSATSAIEAARVICGVADDLFQWDLAVLDLYEEEKDELYPVLRIDTFNDGTRKELAALAKIAPSGRARRVLRTGRAELILKSEPLTFLADADPFGDTSRPSASLMFVPMRNRTKVIGLLSIQSYRLRAYDEQDLAVLQMLADHCGGALERIRAEQALRESEARFRRLGQSNLIGITFWDLNGDVSDANETFLKMIGYTRDDLFAGKINTRTITAPEFAAQDQEALAQVKERGYCNSYEKQYLRKDGTRVDVLAGAAFLEGMADRGVSFVLDISERKSVERRDAALSKLAEKLSATSTPLEAAQLITSVADEILGWDSCYLDLYRAEHDSVSHVLNIDIVYGRKKTVKTFYSGRGPSPMQRQVLEQGPQLILRTPPYAMVEGTRPYGNMAKASASLLFVPIRKGNQVIGFFSVQSYRPNAYSGKDLSTLQTLADHCGAALERIRAQEEISIHAGQQSAVAQLGLRALSGTDWDMLMHEAAAMVAETLAVEFVDIMQLAPDGKQAILVAGKGWKKGAVGWARIEADFDSLLGHVLQSHAPVIIENLKLEFRFSGLELLHDHDLVSGMVLTIPGRSKPWGFIGAHSAQRRSFTQDDVHFLQAVANLLAETIERKRFEERLQIFKEIDYAVLGARSSEAIAEVTLRGAERLLPCDMGLILALNDETHQTRALAIRTAGKTLSEKKTITLDPLQMAELLQPEKKPDLISLLAELWTVPQGNFQATLTVPLLSGENLIGVLALGSQRTEDFSADHREIARELANQLSIAIINSQLFEQVSAGRERLQTLSLRLEEVQDQERRNLARELHDEIGQVLTGLKMFLEIKTRAMPEAYQGSLGEARQLVAELLKRVQELSLNLRPQLLDDLGLLAALRWHLDRYTTQTEIVVEFKHAGFEKRLASEVERTIYRIVQEALTNVARHARVRKVAVRLWISQGNVGVQIEDKGCGFDAEKILAEHVSCGLSGMRERVALLGGNFNLESSPGSGTQLTIELPSRERKATEEL